MNQAIKPALDRLLKIDFLSSVDATIDFKITRLGVINVNSWQEAVNLRGSDKASDAFSEARGRLTRKLSSEYRREYRKWNAIAKDLRSVMEEELFPTADKRVDDIPELRSIKSGPQLVKDSIRWDLVHFGLEQAYSEFVHPSFYSCLVNVYEAGHFPCNWDEAWPDGRLWAI